MCVKGRGAGRVDECEDEDKGVFINRHLLMIGDSASTGVGTCVLTFGLMNFVFVYI